MITLYSGTLGSGKSYKMVAELSRCKDKYFVIHNIDNLKEGYLGKFGVNWIDYCQEQEIEVTEFFSKEFQQEYSKAIFEKYKRPILVIIDEAHEWFDRHVKTFKMWMSYSRHLDQDIWLVAHNSTNIPAVYRSFVGIEYRAKYGAFISLPFYFLYNRVIGGQRGGYTFERKDKKIFELYSSKLINNEKKAKTSPMLPIMVIASILGVMLFFWLPGKTMAHKKVKEEKKVEVPAQNINNNSIKNNIGPAGSAAMAVIVEQPIDKKFAFVGSLGNNIIIEDRKTGNQFALNRITGNWKLVTVDRDNSCQIFNGKTILTLTNSERFIQLASSSPHISSDNGGIIGMTAGRWESPAVMPVVPK